MQENDRAAFEEILAEIFASIDKPLGEAQRSVFWKGLKDLGIVEFARIRDLLVREYRERDEPPRKLTIGDIWAAKRKLRAAAPREPTPEDAWQGDEWDQRANLRLLSYVLRACVRKVSFSPAQTRVLVAHKNRWPDLFRGLTYDEAPADEQQQTWDNCMRMAEAEMAQKRAA